MNPELPPVAPEVAAAAVEGLTSRLRKKLDAAIETYVTAPVTVEGADRRVRCGEDAEVVLSPGPSGAVTDAEQAVCSCLLAPRCLHRAAVLGACPMADVDTMADAETAAGPEIAAGVSAVAETRAMAQAVGASVEVGRPAKDTPGADAVHAVAAMPEPGTAEASPQTGPTEAQLAAARALWTAAAAVLAAGVPAAGAVTQAEVLRASHTARLAGLHRAEAAALRVVRGLRGARSRHDGHRLADLVANLRELLLTTGLLAAADPAPALVGTARRSYRPEGALRVHGVCREPVISATGYGGVVTHLLSDDGRWFTVADVRPGGPARARGAATATVALGAGSLDHAQLSRGGLLISGATLSSDGRLGAGKGVRATPVAGRSWTSGPSAALFARPLAEAVADRLGNAPVSDPERAEQTAGELIGCDLVIVGVVDNHLLAQELIPGGADTDGLLIRLLPSNSHPDLAHTANLRRLASRPGLRLRVVGRLDPDRAATLRPLAVGPLTDENTATLRLPAEWLGHADLGYDRLEGIHLPPADALPDLAGLPRIPSDPVAEAPLWRLRRLVEVAVSGGRRAAAQPARDGDRAGAVAALRRSGFRAAADLAHALAAEADRRGRDVFGRTEEADPDGYACAWLAAAVYLAGTERALVQATWRPSDTA
ncbi:SWIM zinc finger family protein [Streptomyces pseudovenezuelae]|uniref:SWIM-type domain-containing protein n=1 Tax=Streptomyces pseudovenezuelae TaxID=67350 RepID=A0ABT6LV67_9ACTN|nr:SWIM zinc finger family protein [Streptomyces pseudovenezuelae]MDH6219745.1 hypothetical protein [Streptomyces pseudovenezuelae]